LVIPYFAQDVGYRPLPANIPIWLCTSILINGSSYVGALPTGVPVNLSVMVRNAGSEGTLTYARFYYTDASSGFTNLTPIAQTSSGFYIAATAMIESPTVVWTPSSMMMVHTCIVVIVDGATDHAPPGLQGNQQDRHIAQQNIQLLTVAPGETAVLNFYAGNATRHAATFTVTAHTASKAAQGALARLYRTDPISVSSRNIGLQLAANARDVKRSSRGSLSTKLKPHERRLCQVSVKMPADIEAEQFLAVEVEQHGRDAKGRSRLVGATAMIVFPAL
jgi:hypothetical protein